MDKKCVISADQLYKQIDLTGIPFKTTDDIQALASVIGQERAVSSINFALEIDDSGYNVFVTGSYGTGRTTIVSDLLNKAARNRSIPDDLIFVYNFANPDEPNVLCLPAGCAVRFKKKMNRVILNLTADLQKTFESKTYQDSRNEILEKFQNVKQNMYEQVEHLAAELDIQIKSTNVGFATLPIVNGNVLKGKEFQELPAEQQKVINHNAGIVQKSLQQMIRKMNLIDKELDEKIDQLNEDVATFVVDNHFEDLIEAYKEHDDVKKFLAAAAEEIVNTVDEFIREDNGSDDKGTQGQNSVQTINKFQVNILIDNARQKGAPVVHEANPTYNNLFGRIEKKSFQGYIYTDYTMIKPGSLARANGGYLILDAEQLLKHSFAYEALKRSLRSRQLRIEDLNTFYGYSSTVSLRPDPIPLNLKVILVGHSRVFRLLHNYDEEFRKIFKVRADFDTEVKESKNSIRKYVQFIARVVKEENLIPFDRSGVTAVLEHGFRLSESQKKLSIRFGELVRIIREASFWAKKRRKKIVGRQEVQLGIDERVYRHNLVEEKVHESILDKTVNIKVRGTSIGQVNGLAVYSLGDYAFGRPSRITVNTFIGSRGIINIEREAKLSGKIHDKGLLVLNGYFSQKFGQAMPLSFSATITFEQSYGMIDGDSASSTELYGLLSSLSGIPIRQGIAVTGSVNQKGQVQAIGGVNEKIEGFFKVCSARKLTGDQGVIIPKANTKNLLLSNQVIEAVKKKQFHIWAVDNIEDGMLILTGTKCGIKHKDGGFTADSVFELVRQKLVHFAESTHRFRKSLGVDAKKEEKADDE